MLSTLTVAVLVCIGAGMAIVAAMIVRSGRGSQAAGSIAQVLYDAEHPEKVR